MKESITVCELYTVHGIFTDCTIRFSLTATTHSRCVQMHQKESFNTRYRLFFFLLFFFQYNKLEPALTVEPGDDLCSLLYG